MTALAKDRNTPFDQGELLSLPVKADAKIYMGGMVCVGTDGYAIAGVDASGNVFMGIADESADATDLSSGDLHVRVRKGGVHELVGSSLAITDAGKDLWLTDDQTVSLVETNVYIGRLAYFKSATVAPVDIGAAMRRYGPTRLFTVQAHIAGAVGETSKALLDGFEWPRAFKVLRGYATALTAPGSSKTCTITITDGTSPKTFTVAGTAKKGEDEAINQAYAANTDMSISAIDSSGGSTADLSVLLVCEEVN
jgi:hypothetical protein